MPFCSQCGTKSSGGAFCTECGTAISTETEVQPVDIEPTTYENKCDILAELWTNHKGNEDLGEFFSYNDLGLPLAYAVSTTIVESNPTVEGFINETFEGLLTALGRDDEGFVDLDELIE